MSGKDVNKRVFMLVVLESIRNVANPTVLLLGIHWCSRGNQQYPLTCSSPVSLPTGGGQDSQSIAAAMRCQPLNAKPKVHS